MSRRIVDTNHKLAAERQIDAAIEHYQACDFECAITLSSAAEGLMPDPRDKKYLFEMMKQRIAESPREGDDTLLNWLANWLKHNTEPPQVSIEESEVLIWLYRAVSKYCANYGSGTPKMAALFAWAVKPYPAAH